MKKDKKDGNFFHKIKNWNKKQKKKIIFVKFTPKRSAPKWTSNKLSNAKKGHNKTGCAKVVSTKSCTHALWRTEEFCVDLSVGPHPKDQRSKMEEVVPKMVCWRGSDAGKSRNWWVDPADDVCRRYKKNSPSILFIGKRTKEDCDCGSEVGTFAAEKKDLPGPLKKPKESGRRENVACFVFLWWVERSPGRPFIQSYLH